MVRERVLVAAWLPEGWFERLGRRHPGHEWLDGRTAEGLGRGLPRATVLYGLPAVDRLAEAPGLRWVQLISAGVPPELCPVARGRGVTVTNLAGLYGNSLAEHALGLMIVLARRFHLAARNQHKTPA